MKNLVRVISFILVFVLLLLLIVVAVPDSFSTAYQRAIVRQYDYYKNIKGNKVVFLGCSTLAFGFDLDYMEDLSGKQCAMLGNHLSHSLPFLIEMSKSNLQSGDVVVAEFIDSSLETIGAEYLLTGIGKRYDMYKFIIPETRKTVASFYPLVMKKNIMYSFQGGYQPIGYYALSSFDDRGNFVYYREGTRNTESDPEPSEVLSADVDFDPDYIAYLNSFNTWCNDHGVTFLITVVPFRAKMVKSDDASADAYDAALQSVLDAKLVSHSKDYFFADEYSFESNHLNTAGARLRTEKLFNDIKPYLES